MLDVGLLAGLTIDSLAGKIEHNNALITGGTTFISVLLAKWYFERRSEKRAQRIEKRIDQILQEQRARLPQLSKEDSCRPKT